MKTNKVSESKVKQNAPNKKKPDKIKGTDKKSFKKVKENLSKPQIKQAAQKELKKLNSKSETKLVKQKEKKNAETIQDDQAKANLSPEDLLKQEKKKLKKEKKKLKKAEEKEAKLKAKNDEDSEGEKTTVNGKQSQVNPRRDPASSEATVFVGNLPVNTKSVQLKKLFKDFGEVVSIRLRTASGKNLFKHKTRKEAGTLIAYVQLPSSEAATKALALNGTEFKSNHLRVTRSDLKTTLKADGEANYDAKRTIFVGNLKYSATEEKLREIFSSCGEIDYVRCLQDKDKGCKGVAYVCFKSPDAVGLALELNETNLDDRPINVERYSVKKLGAKQKRDADAEQLKTNKKGAFKRLQNKAKTPPKNNKKLGNTNSESQKKKGEFRGVKVDSLKKKNKKKVNNQMKKMAAKIAPKIKPNQGD